MSDDVHVYPCGCVCECQHRHEPDPTLIHGARCICCNWCSCRGPHPTPEAAAADELAAVSRDLGLYDTTDGPGQP